MVARGDSRGCGLIHSEGRIGNGKVHATTSMLCSGKGGRKEGAYVLTPSGALVLPVMRRSQASLHSLMTSSAYFLFLHSPLNANEFSCFPSGIYHQHQNTENTTTTNNRFLHFQCWD